MTRRAAPGRPDRARRSPDQAVHTRKTSAKGRPSSKATAARSRAEFATFSNPLPQVLILTAIVVGISTTALGLGLVVRIKETYGTIEENEIQEIDRR